MAHEPTAMAHECVACQLIPYGGYVHASDETRGLSPVTFSL